MRSDRQWQKLSYWTCWVGAVVHVAGSGQRNTDVWVEVVHSSRLVRGRSNTGVPWVSACCTRINFLKFKAVHTFHQIKHSLSIYRTDHSCFRICVYVVLPFDVPFDHVRRTRRNIWIIVTIWFKICIATKTITKCYKRMLLRDLCIGLDKVWFVRTGPRCM